jgi:predicted nucleotidyltransferase component of viral defense system
VSSGKPTNIAASVRQKLLNLARDTGRQFNEVLQFYAMERFLYRLSVSEHKDKLILKGALMLIAWQAPSARPTTDLDFLGRLSSDPLTAADMIRAICKLEVEDDGLMFDPASIKAESITEDADYRGIRVRFTGKLDAARVRMQLDIGIGDILIPASETIEYPTLLGTPKPVISGYSRESSIAEKLEAMVKLGMANSRMKDFYDIWYLSRWFGFDGAVLAKAISATFERRGTDLSKSPIVFSREFGENSQKQRQWEAFTSKNGLDEAPAALMEVAGEIRVFLGPVIEAIIDHQSISKVWSAKAKWHLPGKRN